MRLLLVVATLAFSAVGAAHAQDTSTSFFVTSVGSGKGADLGGLEGADAHCGSLAEAVGLSGKTWRAYLSTDEVDARDRIGAGPWYNANDEKIADDVASLHTETNGLTKQTALDEKGHVINGRGDTPNRHDILTGSNADGTRSEHTCGNWTMSSAEGAAMLGHSDRLGPETLPSGTSWNAAHPSRGGCSQEALVSTGGDGLFYCFAAN